MQPLLKIPLVLTPQPAGGFTVTSPLLPELVTEGDSAEEALENVRDALQAVLEIYEEKGKALPANLRQERGAEPVWFEYLWSAS
jgi:antitoxin HicB